MPGDSGVTVVTMLVCFFHFACEAAGASGARHSLRPLISGGSDIPGKTRAKTRGEIATSSKLRVAVRGEQSSLSRSGVGVYRLVSGSEFAEAPHSLPPLRGEGERLRSDGGLFEIGRARTALGPRERWGFITQAVVVARNSSNRPLQRRVMPGFRRANPEIGGFY